MAMCLRPILIIDEDPSIRDLLEDILTEYGYNVQTCSHSAHVPQILVQHRPGLILLGIGVPNTSSLEAARRLRHDPFFTHIPLIALATLSINEAVARASGLFDDYLPKPFDLDHLLSVVAKWLIHTLPFLIPAL